MTEIDLAMETELRARRLLWYSGYFNRGNIHIYSGEIHQDIAEIDVLGVRFDNLLNPNYMIIEAKSGQEKGFSSILKLRGFQEYFSSASTAIIRNNITPDIIKFSDDIGIRAYHLSRLDEIEEELGIKDDSWFGNFRKDCPDKIKTNISLLRSVRGNNLELYDNYWSIKNPFYKAKLLINMIKELTAKLDKIIDESAQKAVQWLVLEYIILLSISILESASQLYALPSHQRERIFTEKLISGKLSYEEKETLIGNICTFVNGINRSRNRRISPLKKEEMNQLLNPPYAGDLYNLISLYIKYSCISRQVPRCIDLITYEYYMQNKEINWPDMYKFMDMSEDPLKLTLKLSRDIFRFLFQNNLPKFIHEFYFKE